MNGIKCVITGGRQTTYDFCTGTFGHATMIVGGYDGEDVSVALAELKKARECLAVEPLVAKGDT